MCPACVEQLNQKWYPKKDFDEQPRYLKHNTKCKLWNVLGPLNNWRRITVTDKSVPKGLSTSLVTRNIFRDTLQDRAFSMSSTIEIGNYGAIATTDASALSGYYVFSFTSDGYVLQKQIITNSDKIAAGELVCDITWLNPVPNASRMYSHGIKDDTSLNSTIRIQHIVEGNIKFTLLSSRNMLPKSIRPMFDDLLSKSTIIVNEECHDMIIENIAARTHLDYEEFFSSTEEDSESSSLSGEEDSV